MFCNLRRIACMQERLGVLLEKEDEMDCLVSGSNFLLKAIRHEAFMYENSQTIFAPSNSALPSLPPVLAMVLQISACHNLEHCSEL